MHEKIKDIYKIEIKDNFPIILGLVLLNSYLYNLGFFYFIDIALITLLSFEDYLEGTLPIFGILGFSMLFYFNYFKKHSLCFLWIDILKVLGFKEKKTFLSVFIKLLNPVKVLKILYRIYIFQLPYWLLFVFLVFSIHDELGSFFDITSLYIIFFSCLCYDFFITSRPAHFIVKKKFFRLILLSCLTSFLLGIAFLKNNLQANTNAFLKNDGHNNLEHVRSIKKGHILFDKENHQIIFIPDDRLQNLEIDIIKSKKNNL